MKFVRSLAELAHIPQHRVATIGNFDGVHLGHQLLLQKVQEEVHVTEFSSLVITFYPHPAAYFGVAHTAILGLREKLCQLSTHGIDEVLALHFADKLQQQEPRQFMLNLLQQAKIKVLVVGEDFVFGKDKKGDLALLKELTAAVNVKLVIIPRSEFYNYNVSSSLIKQLLKKSDFKQAAQLLGYNFYRCGRVMYGAKRGRTIGIPTANIRTFDKHLLIRGVFVVALVIKQQRYVGVANWGFRPTFKAQRAQLEVHLFDFAGDLYGELVKIEFLHKIRDEQKFNNIESLKQQIEHDIIAAKRYLKESGDES